MAEAVVAIGEANATRERVALGRRSTGPAEPIAENTIFDLASLTKAVATTTAVLQLAECGRLELDAPASRYWPVFGDAGKAGIALRQLLNHTSGLPSGPAARSEPRDHATVLHAIEIMPPIGEPGRNVIYSDFDYVALGKLIQRVSRMGLDAWYTQHIFQPLSMCDTVFRPSHRAITRIVPAVVRNGRWLRGDVHDPTAAALGGVSDNTDLFSTVSDLTLFARILFNEDSLGGHQILQPDNVALLLALDGSTAVEATHTLGWGMQAPLIPNRYRAPRAGLVQHLSYTGTDLWISLVMRRSIIVLTSRLYPGERDNAMPLREAILNPVSSTAPLPSGQQITTRIPAMADAVIDAERRLPIAVEPVRAGIDTLEAGGFAPLVGKRVGLVTSYNGFDTQGQRTIGVLSQAPGVRLNVIFAPKHGIGTDLDARFGNTINPRSNLVIHNLYSNSKVIPRSALTGLDALVFGLQDAGMRFFTYLAALGATLEATAEARTPMLALDRPNLLGGDLVGGPVSGTTNHSLTNYVPLSPLHGMTIGELAKLPNGGPRVGAALHVVAVGQYDRTMRSADTGLDWVPPSLNLCGLSALKRYPNVGLVEGTRVDVGRSVTAPFGMVRVPWMDDAVLARELNTLDMGAIYTPVHFVPAEGPYHGHSCSGVAVQRVSALTRPGRIGLTLARVLSQRYPEQFKLETIRTSVGSETVWAMLRGSIALDTIERAYTAQADVFLS